MKRFLLIALLLFSYALSAQTYIRYNQAGYYPSKSKRIVLMSENDIAGDSWQIKDQFGDIVLAGVVSESLQGATSHTTKDYNYEIDFSELTTSGDYSFHLANEDAVAIKITCQPYEAFIFDVLKTMRARRSGSSDALIHGLSHTGDKACPIYERNSNSNTDWSARSDGKTADMLGGWYDAGDYIKFTHTSAYACYLLLKSYESNPDLFNGVKQYSTTELNDVLDEAKHGLDFLKKTMPEPDIFIIQTGGYEDHNQGFRMPENDELDGKRECYAALSKPQMSLTAAALALGAKIFKEQGYSQEAIEYLAKAQEIYATAKASTEPSAWWAGNGEKYYADDDEDDNMELAAVELYLATNESVYLDDAKTYGADAGSASWASWANVNMLAHATLMLHYSGVESSLTIDLDGFSKIANETNNIWRAPHTSTWGTLYSYFGVANGALQYQIATDKTTYQSMAIDVLDYTFGLNPWGLSFVASEALPNSITSTYAVMYRLQPSIFPTGEIAEGPTTATMHSQNRTWFDPAHDPSLWHSEFNAPEFTFFEQEGDYVCMETTIGGLADGLFLFTLASSVICDNPCPEITFPEKLSLCGAGEVIIESGIKANSDVTFEWFKDGVRIHSSSIEKNTLLVDKPAIYTLMIDSAGVCTSSSSVEVINEIVRFDLGDDFNLCKPGFKILRTGVSDHGYTFEWSKDDEILLDYTTDSCMVYEAGRYNVVVSASGCDKKSSEVNVTSALPKVIHDKVCMAGEVALSVDAQGGSFEWYGSVDGQKLFTGNVYKTTIDKSTVFYVKDGASTTEVAGLTTTSSGWLNQVSEYLYTTSFDALQDIVLTEVTVFSGGDQDVVITVFESDGTTVVGTHTESVIAGKNVISLNIPIPQGNGYVLSPEGTTGMLQIDDQDITYPITTEGVMSLTGMNTSWGSQDWYANFYNIKVQVGSGCDLTPVFAVVDPSMLECDGNITTQSVTLNEGWNLVSLYVEPNKCTDTQPCVSAIFPNAKTVKTFDGFWESSQPDFLNSLITIKAGEGYLVYNTVDETISISGIPVEVHGHASLQQGWNLVGVPSSGSVPVTDFTNATIIKDFDTFYEKGSLNNSLTELESGKAYFVKIE